MTTDSHFSMRRESHFWWWFQLNLTDEFDNLISYSINSRISYSLSIREHSILEIMIYFNSGCEVICNDNLVIMKLFFYWWVIKWILLTRAGQTNPFFWGKDQYFKSVRNLQIDLDTVKFINAFHPIWFCAYENIVKLMRIMQPEGRHWWTLIPI